MDSVKSSGRSARAASFYSAAGTTADGGEAFASHGTTTGPWSADAQHGGPPAALLGRALERLPEAAGTVLGRFAMDILGPVPVGPLEVRARVLRPGRSVCLTEAGLYDATADRLVAVARGWHFPDREGPRPDAEPLPHRPEDGVHEDPPRSWHRGYLDAMEWSWIRGAVTRPGPGVVWMRPRVALVEGEEPDGVQRLLACVDSASGVSAELDADRWGFLNTELTVHLLRPPVGEWVCVDARTTLGPGSVGLAVSTVHDEKGLVARSAQALLVAPR